MRIDVKLPIQIFRIDPIKGLQEVSEDRDQGWYGRNWNTVVLTNDMITGIIRSKALFTPIDGFCVFIYEINQRL